MFKTVEGIMVKPHSTNSNTLVLAIRECGVKGKKTSYPKGNEKGKVEGPTQTLRWKILTKR